MGFGLLVVDWFWVMIFLVVIVLCNGWGGGLVLVVLFGSVH